MLAYSSSSSQHSNDDPDGVDDELRDLLLVIPWPPCLRYMQKTMRTAYVDEEYNPTLDLPLCALSAAAGSAVHGRVSCSRSGVACRVHYYSALNLPTYAGGLGLAACSAQL